MVDTESDENKNLETTGEGPTNGSLYTIIKDIVWLERESDSSLIKLVLLKWIRDLAVRKWASRCVKKTINVLVKTIKFIIGVYN